jgi:ankyrin repeat protein
MKIIYENLKLLNIEDIKVELYDNLSKAIFKGDKILLLKTLEDAKNTGITIDLSNEDGLYCVLAAKNGYKDLLEILCNHDTSLIGKHGTEMLSHAASHGQIECVQFLLNSGANPSELLSTTAYNNYEEVKVIFDEYIAEHDVKATGDIIIHTEAY